MFPMFPLLYNFRAKARVFFEKHASIVMKYHAEIASLF
jgi:hypothetical protein